MGRALGAGFLGGSEERSWSPSISRAGWVLGAGPWAAALSPAGDSLVVCGASVGIATATSCDWLPLCAPQRSSPTHTQEKMQILGGSAALRHPSLSMGQSQVTPDPWVGLGRLLVFQGLRPDQ